MAKCDLCGGNCAAYELAQLLDQYQAAGVRDVCPACRRWADKTKGDLIAKIAPEMRAAVEARKGAPPTPWWRRGLSALRAA
jgi:hypothetical protein